MGRAESIGQQGMPSSFKEQSLLGRESRLFKGINVFKIEFMKKVMVNLNRVESRIYAGYSVL
jgi:hypothetical protein